MTSNDVRRSVSAASLCVLGCWLGAAASAAEIGYDVHAGAGYSDNIARTVDDKQDETIGTVGLGLNLSESSKRLDASLVSALQYRDYLDDTFDSEFVGQLVGKAGLQLITDRLSWMLEDTFGQATEDQFSPDTPTNRENVNYLSTGPTLSIPLTRRFVLQVDGRYSDVHYEDSDLGNDRLRGSLELRREISNASSLSLVGSTEKVEFDDDQTFVNFDRDEYYLRYALHGARTNIDADVGATKVRRKDGGDSDTGEILRLRASRKISSAATLTFDAGREFSDAGNAFRQLQTGPELQNITQPVQQVADVFRNTFGTLRWDLDYRRSSLSMSASVFDERYEIAEQLDRRRWEYVAGVYRQLGRAVGVNVGAMYSKQEFRRIDREFSEWSGFAGAQWRPGLHVYVSLQLEHADRNDDVDLGNYKENEVWLRVGYRGGNIEESGSPLRGSQGF